MSCEDFATWKEATDPDNQAKGVEKHLEEHSASLRMNIFQRTRVLLNHRESLQVLEEIIRRGEAIALDCEGINLSTPVKGQITLVQVGIMSGQAYLLDVSTDPKIWEELKAVLECSHVVKVLHDSRNISSILTTNHGIHLSNVFDAQVSIRCSTTST